MLSQKNENIQLEKRDSIKYLLEKLVTFKYIESFNETNEFYTVKFSKEEINSIIPCMLVIINTRITSMFMHKMY